MALRNRRLPATLSLFVALAVLHTWPLAMDPAGLSRNDNADTMLNEWIIAWIAHQAPRDPLHLFDANIFYPERRTLAFSEHLVVPAVMVAPVLWFGGSPVLAYNLLVIAGFALTGWTMSLLIGRWTDDRAAGILAGCLMAFNTHTLTRLPHVQALHVEFLPLVILAFDALLLHRRISDALKLALWFALQGLSSIYLLMFSVVALAMGMVARPTEWIGRRSREILTRLALAGGLAALATLPFLLPYYLAHREHGLARSLDEVALYSASATDYLSTVATVHYSLWSHRFYRATNALFPGVTALVLAAVGLVAARRDRRARMFVAIGACGVLLSFGPAFPVYPWLYRAFPLLQAIRSAARFGYLGLVAVAALAGFGLARLRHGWAHRPPGPPSWLAAMTAAVLVLANLEALSAPIGYVRFDGIPPVYRQLASERDAVIAEFPFFSADHVAHNASYMLNSTAHWRPLANGYSGFIPESFVRRAEVLRGFPHGRSLDELRAAGVTHVIIHTDEFDGSVEALDRNEALVSVASARGVRIYRVRPIRVQSPEE